MYRINVSGGELFELIRPAALILSAVLSTWVLTSALKRFALFTSLLWAIATFFLPMIVGPLYLALITIRRRKTRILKPLSRRLFLSLTYAGLILTMIGFYVVGENRGADAFIARATQARLNNDHAGAIRQYRSALNIENNAHTHKLLAIELAEAGMLQEAVDEFRLAQSGGEPDDSISYRLGELLEKLDLPDQAAVKYREFLASEMCTRSDRDNRCNSAETRVKKIN